MQARAARSPRQRQAGPSNETHRSRRMTKEEAPMREPPEPATAILRRCACVLLVATSTTLRQRRPLMIVGVRRNFSRPAALNVEMESLPGNESIALTDFARASG